MIDDTDPDVVERFAEAVRPHIKESEIEKVRQYSIKQGNAPDWPWNRFVHAFASMGGNRHWDENIYPNLEDYSWASVERLPSRERNELFENVTNPRWRNKG
jgi:hypothetical protein